MRNENIVALCDVDEERADGSLKNFAGRFPAESEKYGAAPPDFTAAIAAHDAISYVQVMQKAGVIDDSEAIRNAFLETDAETFFGPNSFDDDR